MKCLEEDEGVGQGAAEEGAVLLAQRTWALVTRVSLTEEGRQSAVSPSARDFRLLRFGPLLSDCRMTVGGQDVMAHSVFWPMRELHGSLVLDLGCMLSVAGTRWVNHRIQRLRGLGRWMKTVPEKESFRFGDGHGLVSEYSFMFEATVLGVRVILKLSVVPGDCPPLFSKPACTQLGMVIDTDNHTVSSRRLKISRYGVAQTVDGRYAVLLQSSQTP